MFDSGDPIINDYFLELGLPKERFLRIKVCESYSGSWIMEAALVIFASIGTPYTILKGIYELLKIANELTELKNRLKKEFSKKAPEKLKCSPKTGQGNKVQNGLP